jgi:hypothetical protein
VSDVLTAKIRCTLEEGHARNDVTGVAVVANRTLPPAPPQEQADETGDAHRVFPYAQTPMFVEIDPEAISANPGECQTFTAFVADENGRAIPAANVDVHAEGPNDQLRFGSITNTTSPFQAPEDSPEHPSRENAIKCSDGTASGQQGDHNRPGQDDIKHIESTEGTDDSGAFVFALRADAVGSTVIDVWAEEDDDDVQDSSEGAGGARVGWGEPPPPPEIELSMSPSSASSSQGSCKAITLVAKEGGNPLGGTNADVHITGPDQTVNFCDPPDADPRRAPDAGGHVVDSHEDGTRHAEGETDAQGTFTFGVISSTVGTTQVLAWIDAFDDDLQDGSEESASGSITWEPAGERDVSIDTNKDKVDVGGKVKIFGSISGDSSCESSQEVKLKARKRGGKFKTIETDTTDADGDYSFQIEVRKTKDYRVLAPAAGICEKAKSSIVTVKAK